MATSRLFDYMQNYPFWLLDISPSKTPPFFALLPILGFQSIVAPELTLETQEIVPGNSFFKKHHVMRGSVSSITLMRGAQFWDSDYWRWIYNATVGNQGVRRDLMLIHYMSYSPSGATGTEAKAIVAAAKSASVIAGAITDFVAVGFGSQVSEMAPRVPGRMWKLRGCLPTRYKAASDFDATSSDVSLMELEVQPTYFEEISLTSPF
jgi:phage tail-like protein